MCQHSGTCRYWYHKNQRIKNNFQLPKKSANLIGLETRQVGVCPRPVDQEQLTPVGGGQPLGRRLCAGQQPGLLAPGRFAAPGSHNTRGGRPHPAVPAIPCFRLFTSWFSLAKKTSLYILHFTSVVDPPNFS